MFYGIFWLIGRGPTRYVIKHAERKKENYKGRVARRYKRKRLSCRRDTTRYDEGVDERLNGVNTGYADRRKIAEMILCLNGDFYSANNNKQNESEEHRKPDKTRFFADYREDKIAFGKRKKPEFLPRIEIPHAEPTARTESV